MSRGGKAASDSLWIAPMVRNTNQFQLTDSWETMNLHKMQLVGLKPLTHLKNKERKKDTCFRGDKQRMIQANLLLHGFHSDLSVVTFGPVSGLYPSQRNVSYFRHKVTLHYGQLVMPRSHQRAAYDEGNC